MDTHSSLTAELYFWGHFDVFQNAAEQFADKGNVDYSRILKDNVEQYLRAVLRQLPMHQSLEDAVKEWFNTAEFFSKKCPDWSSWGFPEEKESKENEYFLPVLHLSKLAVDAFDITTDGRLCRPDEEDLVRFTRFGCVPPELLGAIRYALRKNSTWNGQVVITSEAATQEFQALVERKLADAHVHLSGAASFIDLLYHAIRGITPPCLSNGGTYLENGYTHDKYDYPFHELAIRPLLLACKAMFVALLCHAENRRNMSFKEFLGKTLYEYDVTGNERKTIDNSLSRNFWKRMYLAAKAPDGSFANRFDISIANILKKVGNYKRFFDQRIPFEKNWYMIVRHVLEYPDDKDLCYHFIQLTHCICCLYRPMFHREGFYEFDHLFRYLDLLIDAAGHPSGRPPKRSAKDAPLERISYDSIQKHCQYLRQLQLRINVRATRKRTSRRSTKRERREPLREESWLKVELHNHLATYKKYIEEQEKFRCHFCEKKVKNGQWKDKCPHCGEKLLKSKPLMITFPIHFIRREQGDESSQRKNFHFKLLWHRVELLASLFLKKPALRYFFGRIDVANNEDLKPNWVFALMFNELEDRLKKITRLSGELKIPRMRYNCHAGEHFTSSIQGLRRIWEPVRHFPHLEAIGHAFALGIPGRLPAEMPADELLDDLVWVLLHREHIQQGLPLERIERIGEKITEEIYGKKFGKNDEAIHEILYRDLKDAYLWRFDRERIAKFVGILSRDKKSGEYHYSPDFKLSKEEKDKPFPKAAKILRKYFTRKEVGRPYKLSRELRDILEKCYPSLRDFVKQEIISKNIVVEVCPSSNFRIGNLTKIEDHPLFTMCPPNLNGGVSTVFGTDNPAMFQTAIDDEYLYVKEAMDKKYPDMPMEKRLEYLETIRRRSTELCCDDLPNESVAILDLIERACE